MLFSPVYSETQPRRSAIHVRARTSTSTVRPCNSHGIISFADPHSLTAIESYRYKKRTGGGGARSLCQVLSQTTNSSNCHTSGKSPITPLLAADPNSFNSKPFDCHTYETPRGLAHKLLTSNRSSSCLNWLSYTATVRLQNTGLTSGSPLLFLGGCND